jgi:hypothetical protein
MSHPTNLCERVTSLYVSNYFVNWDNFIVNSINKLIFAWYHCEPFAFCHSERSEESLFPSLRINSMKQSHEIATPACGRQVASLLAMTTLLKRSP